MTRRRRAAGLLVLAALLGGLAASSVSRREAAVDRALGPLTTVLVTRAPVRAGALLSDGRPVARTLPRRYAPPDAIGADASLGGSGAGAGADAGGSLGGSGAGAAADSGGSLGGGSSSGTRAGGPLGGARAAVALPAGAYITAGALRTSGAADSYAIGPGERVADIVANADPRTVVAGAHVDVLVTRDGTGDRPGTTVLALQDVEVLAARPSASAADTASDASPGTRVAAELRVTLHQAVYLAAAQSFARELRLLARAPGDSAQARAGDAVDQRLR